MSATVVAAFLERASAAGSAAAYRTLAVGGAPCDSVLSWEGWAAAARTFAAALVADGHHPGEAVAVLAGNVEAWPIADLGVLMAAGVSVGVYPTSAPPQVRQVLADCGATTVVVDSAEQLAKVRAVRAELPALRRIVTWGGFDRAAEAGAVSWEGWLTRGMDILARDGAGDEIARRAAAARPDDTAILIYTSGSTGEPKGAELSHRTLLASAASIRDALGMVEGDSTLSFLPFCHAAERIFGLYTRIVVGMEAALVADHARVWDAAREYAPTVFGGLPRFYEKAYEALRSAQGRAAGEERARWDRAVELGRVRSRVRRSGQAAPPALEAEWRSTAAPFAARLAETFGGRVRLATSGGATLPVQVAEYLDALGMTVLGAYGLTEHLCVAFNRPDAYAFDHAGPPMPGTGLRIAADGEILVRRGALTFTGYHGRPEETRAAFSDDGEWLLTGDLGEIAPDSGLRVTGRKKELIALSTGKKVAPLPIEARLTQEPWIGQAMLYGEGEKFISALLTLRPPAVEAWARDRSLDTGDPALPAHPALLGEVQAAVDRVNATLSRPEQVRRFAVLEREWTPEGGELTPTLKLRRAAIAAKYADRLRALYTPEVS